MSEHRDRIKQKRREGLMISSLDQRYPASFVVALVPLSSLRGCLTIGSYPSQRRENSIGKPRNCSLPIGTSRRRRTGGSSSTCSD
jgi:hypothetical protein